MALAAQILELVSSSVLLLLILPLILFTAYSQTLGNVFGNPEVMGRELVGTLRPDDVLIGFLLPDFVITMLAIVVLRRPGLLLLAPFLPALRIVDAFVCLRSIPTAFRTHSNGSWVSPTRRGTPPNTESLTPPTTGETAARKTFSPSH